MASFIPILYQQVKHQQYLPHPGRMSRSLNICSLHASSPAVIQFPRDQYNLFKRVSRYFQRYCYLIKFDNILLDSTEYNLIQDQAHSLKFFKKKGEKENVIGLDL